MTSKALEEATNKRHLLKAEFENPAALVRSPAAPFTGNTAFASSTQMEVKYARTHPQAAAAPCTGFQNKGGEAYLYVQPLCSHHWINSGCVSEFPSLLVQLLLHTESLLLHR